LLVWNEWKSKGENVQRVLKKRIKWKRREGEEKELEENESERRTYSDGFAGNGLVQKYGWDNASWDVMRLAGSNWRNLSKRLNASSPRFLGKHIYIETTQKITEC
jgi:hypothetical protein